MNARRTAAGVIAAVTSIALAGCGGDEDNGVADMSADEILEEAKKAAGEAESASISGEMVDDEGMAITLDFEFSDAGGTGTLGAEGVEFEVLSVDDTLYMKGAADAWDQAGGEGLGQLVADKYVLIPADQAESFGQFASFTDLAEFMDEMLSPEGDVTVGDETEIDGQKVIGIDDEGSTLFVATTGDALPVRIEAPEGEEGAIDFEWGIDVEITAPPEDEVIDLSSLM